MRDFPSQTATISLPAELLQRVDEACRALSATRSEVVRAALRDFLRQLARDEALLASVRTKAPDGSEEELAERASVSRRARRQPEGVPR